MTPRPSTAFEPLEPRLLLDGAVPAYGELGPVEAGGAEIDVPAYSVPALSDWNNDGLTDLLVGEKVTEYCGPCVGDRDYVFVSDEEGVFERREVRLGRRWSEWTEILGGVEEGERVVVAGAFALKSELLKGGLEGHDH